MLGQAGMRERLLREQAHRDLCIQSWECGCDWSRRGRSCRRGEGGGGKRGGRDEFGEGRVGINLRIHVCFPVQPSSLWLSKTSAFLNLPWFVVVRL